MCVVLYTLFYMKFYAIVATYLNVLGIGKVHTFDERALIELTDGG